jgi:hypothetical protein
MGFLSWRQKVLILDIGGETIMIFFGTLIIVVGVFFLLRNLGIISAELWDILWPTVLIIIGVKLLLGPRRWHHLWKQFEGGKKIKIE